MCSSFLLSPLLPETMSGVWAGVKLARAARSCRLTRNDSEGENMRIGITMFPTDYAIPPHELAIEAEARGFESLWFPEHSHIPTSRKSPWPGGAELPKWYYDTYDPFVAMAAAAVVTKTIKLGTGVCLVVQRDPIHTAKEVATVDRLSGRPRAVRHRRRLERRGDGRSRHGVRHALQADARAHRGDEGDLGAARSRNTPASW